MRARIRRPVLGAVVALLLSSTGWLPARPAAAAPVPPPDAVQVTVLSVTPTSPVPGDQAHPITVRLELTNTTGARLRHLRVEGVRGNPINNQRALDAVIGAVQVPDPQQAAAIRTKHPVTASLGPHETTQLDYVSTTSTSLAAGVCLCQNRIYPLYFAVHAQRSGGADVVVGRAQTFVPSFGASVPEPVQVSWVWPLLERPHRTTSYNLFTDDDLAGSVSGGRLDRLLTTLELIVEQAPSTPLTLLADPDLIDELAVMAAGPYRVRSGPGRTQPGDGTAAARSWLERLRDVLAADPQLQLAFTPYADPDVRSLAAHGLDWDQHLTAAAQRRIAAAIGGHPVDTGLSWPAGASLDESTLAALVRSGVHTVIVGDETVPGSRHRTPRPDALAPMRSPAGPATLAVTAGPIQYYAAAVLSRGGPGLALLPQLVAELAVRAVVDGSRPHYVVITAPRDVDPDPAAASQAVLDTTQAGWATPLSLRQALDRVEPVRQGELHEQPRRSRLPTATLRAAAYLAEAVPTVASLLTDPHPPSGTGGGGEGGSGSPAPSGSASPGGPATDVAAEAAKLVAGLPIALQRSESTEWAGSTRAGAELAQSLQQRAAEVIDGVHLIRPTQGTYTLGSSDSPLPITVDNTLSLPVHVRLRVSAVGGLPGFHADDVGVLTVGPRSKLPVHVPVHVDRAGRIRVEVELLTPDREHLGTSLQLSVRSTALGHIGKIITYAAGGVLALALLLRLLRQWYRRRHRPSPSESPQPPVHTHV